MGHKEGARPPQQPIILANHPWNLRRLRDNAWHLFYLACCNGAEGEPLRQMMRNWERLDDAVKKKGML